MFLSKRQEINGNIYFQQKKNGDPFSRRMMKAIIAGVLTM